VSDVLRRCYEEVARFGRVHEGATRMFYDDTTRKLLPVEFRLYRIDDTDDVPDLSTATHSFCFLFSRQ